MYAFSPALRVIYHVSTCPAILSGVGVAFIYSTESGRVSTTTRDIVELPVFVTVILNLKGLPGYTSAESAHSPVLGSNIFLSNSKSGHGISISAVSLPSKFVPLHSVPVILTRLV